MEQVISHEPPLLIGERAEAILRRIATTAMDRAPEVATRLLHEVDRADLVPDARIPADVVALDSFVTYEVVLTGAVNTIQLVRPHEADLDRMHVSIISGMGAALIGLRAGQQIQWELGGRMYVIRVIRVSDVPDSTVDCT